MGLAADDAGKKIALAFELKADWQQWSWGLQFLAACTPARASAATRQLLSLAALSRRTLDGWLREADLQFGFQCNGKLVLCPDIKTLERQARQVRLQSQSESGAALVQHVLDQAQCLAREPALREYGSFSGGIWTESECSGDPYLFCSALVNASRQLGLRCQFGTRVQKLVMAGAKVKSLETSQGLLHADTFALATGATGQDLARQTGEHLPLYPIKGYSVTLRMKADGGPAPATSVTDLGKKMVLAPINGSLRVAAMADVVGYDLTI